MGEKYDIPADSKVIRAQMSRLGQAQTLEDLLKVAVAVRTSVKFVAFMGTKEHDAYNHYKPELEKQYNYNSGVITFYYQGIMYNMPHSHKAVRILQQNGFVRNDNMGVLCNGTIVEYEDYWNQVEEDSNILDAIEMVDKIKEMQSKPFQRPDGKIIEDLSPEAKERCYKIPDIGVDTIGFAGQQGHITPYVAISAQLGVNVKNAASVGTYDTNNGVMVIFTPSGTYVTKSDMVKREVSGKYEKSGAGVPFSNGERPSDKREAEIIEEAFLSDEEYALKHRDQVKQVQRELEELRYEREEAQRKELEETKRDLEASKKEIEELKRQIEEQKKRTDNNPTDYSQDNTTGLGSM